MQYFDSAKLPVVQADVSEYGLGAVLLQEGHAVAFACRALTSVERNYAQIEKELLAALFALEKFDQYVYGRPTKVCTDHKPLESVIRKPLHDAPRQLQRLLMRMQRYDISLEYIPGRQLPIADTLSRAPCGTSSQATNTKNLFLVGLLKKTSSFQIQC